MIHSGEAASAPNKSLSHDLTPESVMSLAADLYRCNAPAFSVTLGGQNFAHGESLSPAVEAALPAMVARIQELIRTIQRALLLVS